MPCFFDKRKTYLNRHDDNGYHADGNPEGVEEVADNRVAALVNMIKDYF